MNNLFYQYFSEGVDISKFDNLLNIAIDSGLERSEVSRILKSNSFLNEVLEKDSFAKLRLRVSGVPSFTINYQSKRKELLLETTYVAMVKKVVLSPI